MNVQASDLVAFDLFSGLTPDQLDSCAALFSEQRVLMGERLTEKDDFSYSLFLVLEGAVKVSIDGDVVATLGKGDYFGEVGLVRGERRNAEVTATETCRVAKLMTWDFEKLTETHPVLADRLEAKAAERGG